MLFFERAAWEEQGFIVNPRFLNRKHATKQHDPNEFARLCQSAGVTIVGSVAVTRPVPDPKFFIGEGKAIEIAEQLKLFEQVVLLVNDDLSPSQTRNLEKQLSCRVVDRTGVILDIFAQRAQTYEGKLQVQLAQLQHLSTRLVRGWTHLERQKGGIGLRGPGETQLEADRRMVRQQIETITRRLQGVSRQRAQSRRSRLRTRQPTVSFVGYTNAGKSSLFNRLTDADILAKDQLFSTLDPTVRRLQLREVGTVFLTDTVGFISHLPHTLVDAFKATLEEALLADLLVIVTDYSEEQSERMAKQAAVLAVLEDIGAQELPVLEVFNKIDGTDQAPRIDRDEQGLPKRVWLSAKTQAGLNLFQQALSERLVLDRVERRLRLKPDEGKLRAQLYEHELVSAEVTDETGISFLQVAGDRSVIDQILAQHRRQLDPRQESD